MSIDRYHQCGHGKASPTHLYTNLQRSIMKYIIMSYLEGEQPLPVVNTDGNPFWFPSIERANDYLHKHYTASIIEMFNLKVEKYDESTELFPDTDGSGTIHG